MRKRIQKYQNSGVLTGGSNLTPPLPQPASLTSMIQRAYTKKANLNKGFGIAGSIAVIRLVFMR